MIDNVFVVSFIIAFIFGLMAIIYKVILKDVSAETLFYLYFIISFIIVMMILLCRRDNLQIDKLTGKTLALIALTALFGGVVVYYLYFKALHMHSAYLVTVLISISPLFTAVLAYFFLKEKITVTGWIGIILVIVGLVVISINGA